MSERYDAAYALSDSSSDLIHTRFIGGDGNFRLRRFHKGGGEEHDPSLFANDAFYAHNEQYKVFCSMRGGAPDDLSVNCQLLFCAILLNGKHHRISPAD